MVERVFDNFGGHINDQSDLQRAHHQAVSTVNGHQDREINTLQVRTQALSVLLHRLLDDHTSLITHVWDLQNIISYNLLFRSLLPVPFVLSLAGIDGSGSDSSSKSSNDSHPNSSPSPSPHSFQTCISRSSPSEEGVRPSVRPFRTASVWFPPEPSSVVRSFQPLSADPNATNLNILHGEEMVREVLMDMMQEMRPPPQHNVFECRNCQWVERRGKMMLKPCENSPAYRPAPPPYEEDYCSTCLSFEDCLCPDP